MNVHNNTNKKLQQAKKHTIFKVIPEEKQQLKEESKKYNVRRVLCKSFFQEFSMESNHYEMKLLFQSLSFS